MSFSDDPTQGAAAPGDDPTQGDVGPGDDPSQGSCRARGIWRPDAGNRARSKRDGRSDSGARGRRAARGGPNRSLIAGQRRG